jgi:hypothetical protein
MARARPRRAPGQPGRNADRRPVAATTEIVNLGGDRAPEDVRLAGRAGGRNVGERNGQYRHGERTKAAIAERQKFSALIKMLHAGLT